MEALTPAARPNRIMGRPAQLAAHIYGLSIDIPFGVRRINQRIPCAAEVCIGFVEMIFHIHFPDGVEMDNLILGGIALIRSNTVMFSAIGLKQRMIRVVRVVHPVFAPTRKHGVVHREPRAVRQNKFTVINDMGHCGCPRTQVRALDQRSIAKVVAPCRVASIVYS